MDLLLPATCKPVQQVEALLANLFRQAAPAQQSERRIVFVAEPRRIEPFAQAPFQIWTLEDAAQLGFESPDRKSPIARQGQPCARGKGTSLTSISSS